MARSEYEALIGKLVDGKPLSDAEAAKVVSYAKDDPQVTRIDVNDEQVK